MLISGGDDRVWPASTISRQLEQRMAENDRAQLARGPLDPWLRAFPALFATRARQRVSAQSVPAFAIVDGREPITLAQTPALRAELRALAFIYHRPLQLFARRSVRPSSTASVPQAFEQTATCSTYSRSVTRTRPFAPTAVLPSWPLIRPRNSTISPRSFSFGVTFTTSHSKEMVSSA